ncbi:PqqD family protein [Anaerostipes faecalis]|uniref:PqqD family protein n=1 Tax=Anaerostipes faecalis TaxID=2738446 RepID=UPI001C1E50AC|nr:PqqD family protein [Anaerostipes faecalis]
MKRNSDFMLRNIAGEVVLVPTGQATQQFNGLITLNEVAAFIWKNLDEAGTREQLVKMILDEFEVDQKTAEADVDGFINALKEHDMIVE